MAQKKKKTTSHHNFCTNDLRRNDLENKTQGITFDSDVGITIWVLEKLKWLQQCWYCSTHLNMGFPLVISKRRNFCTVKSYVHVKVKNTTLSGTFWCTLPCVRSPPTQKPTKNQLPSDRLAIYCDAPVYKAHTYVTEELLMDRRKKTPGNLFLMIPSKDSGR